MCRRADCARCGKPTFAGCGAHVEQVLRDVPKSDRCRCNEAPQTAPDPAQRAGVFDWLHKHLPR